jgi:hypothetical protein
VSVQLEPDAVEAPIEVQLAVLVLVHNEFDVRQ